MYPDLFCFPPPYYPSVVKVLPSKGKVESDLALEEVIAEISYKQHYN